MALVLVITTVVAVIGWHQLTGVVTMVANRALAPYRMEFGLVDASVRGLVRIKELALFPPPGQEREDGEPWIEIENIEITYDLKELRRERRIRTALIQGPVIRIDEAFAEVLSGPEEGEDPDSAEEEDGSSVPDLSFLGNLADQLSVIGGRIEVDLEKVPAFQTGWDVEIPGVDFSSKEWITEELVRLNLSDLILGEEGSLGTIERLVVSGRLHSNFQIAEIGELAITAPNLTLSPESLKLGAGIEREQEEGEESEDGSAAATLTEADTLVEEGFALLVNAFRISDAAIALEGFGEGSDPTPIPDLDFRSDLEWRSLDITSQSFDSAGPLTLVFDEVTVDGRPATDPESEAPTARIDRLSVTFKPEALLKERRIESLEIHEPDLMLTPETLARFLPGPGAGETADDFDGEEAAVQGGEEEPQPGSWAVGKLLVQGGTATAADWEWQEKVLPPASLEWELEWSNLSERTFAASIEAPESENPNPEQRILLQKVRWGNSNSESEDSLVSIDRIEARFDWQGLLSERRVDSVQIREPWFLLTDDRLPEGWEDWLSPGEGDSPQETGAIAEEGSAPESAPGEPASPFLIEDLSLEGGRLQLDALALGSQVPLVEARFQISSELPPPGEDAATHHWYRLFVSQLDVRAREEVEADSTVAASSDGLSEQEVATVRQLVIDATAEGLQRDRRVERIEIKGADFYLGAGLKQLIPGEEADGEDKQPSAEPATAPEELPEGQRAGTDPNAESEWRLGEFVVTESRVHIESLIPQVEGLDFALETSLNDVPLGQAGLLLQDQPQKVELAGIEIRDPYDSFLTVALVPTIFVEFSFAGLLNQRIEKIDLMNPSIYVGQPLFWWVDYQRNYRFQNEGSEFAGPGSEEEESESAEGGAWKIGQINAHFGKLVIAPTGQPIGVVPFPFEAQTNLDEGSIALNLQIPKEQQYVYEFPDLKLALFGLSGNVDFNVPIEQKDNNLVQTFNLDRAVWKQFEAEKLYLTVTYDTNGIYGRFGGEAYGGYAEGQFNVYLDDVGLWDAWLAGTEMDMGPITEVIAPESFLMDGKVDAKLVSEGRKLEFGETFGELRTLSPGHFDFTKANDFIQSLPEEWSMLKRSATKLSLETLKRFEYETGKGDLYFINQDGWMKLKLEGDTGSRNLEVFAHDWRGEFEAKESSEAELESESQESEVSVSSEEPGEGGEAEGADLDGAG